MAVSLEQVNPNRNHNNRSIDTKIHQFSDGNQPVLLSTMQVRLDLSEQARNSKVTPSNTEQMVSFINRSLGRKPLR